MVMQRPLRRDHADDHANVTETARAFSTHYFPAEPEVNTLPTIDTPHDALTAAWAVLETVCDPELPTLSICDLGIVRAVHLLGRCVTVTITPTYSGCPAMDTIASDITVALNAAGFEPQVHTQLSPAWTTDWMRPEAREKLRRIGIAAPTVSGSHCAGNHGIHVVGLHLSTTANIPCPQCASPRVEQLSHFGSTACKSLYRCLDCREPFDYFKPI